jgi:hypothetical protein
MWCSLWVPIVVGLVLRLLWIAVIPVSPLSDGIAYWEFARSLASGHGYAYPDGSLTAYWPVGTSAVYALGQLALGPGFLSVLVINVLVYLGTAWALWKWADNLGLTSGQRALSAWLLAVWPLGIQFSTVVASELLFNALWMSALALWPVKSCSARSLRWILSTALMVGAVYVRPTALPLVLWVPLCTWLCHRDVRRFGSELLVVGATVLILIAPWAVRNKEAVSAYVPVSTNFGPNFWMGNNPNTDGGFMWLLDKEFANEVERDKFYRQQAIDYIVDQPGEFLLNVPKRAWHTLSRETIGVHWNMTGIHAVGGESWVLPLKWLSSAYWFALLVGGVFGIARLLTVATGTALGQPWHGFWGAFMLFLAVPLITVGMDRYHLALNPLLMLTLPLAWGRLPLSSSRP